MPYFSDQDGNITYVDGFPHGDEYVEIPEPPNGETVIEKTKMNQYDMDNEEFIEVNVPPSPSEAKSQTLELFQQWEDTQEQALSRMRTLKSDYLYLELVEEQNYDLAKTEIDQAVSDGELTDSEAQDLKDMLDGTLEVT